MSASVRITDTTESVVAQQVERWRAMSVVERFDAVASMNRSCLQMAEAGVRVRHPSAGDDEMRLRVLALQLGRDAMVGVYGWDPELEGW